MLEDEGKWSSLQPSPELLLELELDDERSLDHLACQMSWYFQSRSNSSTSNFELNVFPVMIQLTFATQIDILGIRGMTSRPHNGRALTPTTNVKTMKEWTIIFLLIIIVIIIITRFGGWRWRSLYTNWDDDCCFFWVMCPVVVVAYSFVPNVLFCCCLVVGDDSSHYYYLRRGGGQQPLPFLALLRP